MSNVKVLPTVEDIETAKAVFVARALVLCDIQGYSVDGRAALEAAGLSDYFGSDKDTYVIDTTRLKELLGDSFTARLASPRTPRTRPGAIRDAMYGLLVDWADGITDAEWTQAQPSPKIVDTDAVCAIFGTKGALPPAGSEQVTQVWRELTLKVLKWADDGELCNTVETFLNAIGMGDFVPARNVKVAVTWQGATFELDNVPTNRMGEPKLRDVRYLLQNQIAEKDLTVTLVAVPASA